jgi:hypothetical protein
MYDLLQVMQQDGYLSSGELIALRKTCKELGENPVRVLRSLNIASPEQIQEYLQRYFRVNALSDQAIAMLDEGFQTYIPIDLAIHYSCFGLGEENSVLYVAMEDPSDRGSIQQLRFFLNKRIIAISATVFQLAEGLSKIYRVSIPNLRLTTVIEKSRGVIGGLRYEAPYEAEAISIGDDFAGANLSDQAFEDVNTFVSSTPESSLGARSSDDDTGLTSSEPSAEISTPDMNSANTPNSPSVGFIDGSSGEVEEGMLKPDPFPPVPAEVAASSNEIPVEQANNDERLLSQDEKAIEANSPEAPVEPEAQLTSSVTDDGLLSDEESAGEISEESKTETSEVSIDDGDDIISDMQSLDEKSSEIEISENKIAQLSALASSALIKVSMLKEKNQAIELVNSLLEPFKFSVTLKDNDSYQVNGEDFSASGNLSSKIKPNDNPIFYAIDPILKRILKMKDSL